jgi:prepilin-type N-terminal cleavage/methylation domain-containing protein
MVPALWAAPPPGGEGGFMARTSLRRGERGFTLIEILVVITIIAALIGIVAAVIPRAMEGNRKLQCANNLKNIGAMLTERSASKGLGTRGGSALLLQVYKLGMIRKGDERVFLCPGDVQIRGQNIDDQEFKKRYDSIDLDHIDPMIISYAGRNRKLYKILPDAKEKQAWACDCQGDDNRTSHHKSGLNVLFDDNSVVFMDHEALGLQPEDPIVIGMDSNQDLLKQFIVVE